MYRDIAYFKKGIDTEESGRLLSLYFFARIADYIRLKAIEEEDD